MITIRTVCALIEGTGDLGRGQSLSTKRSVLLVEDHPAVSEMLLDYLGGQHGFAIIVARTLDEAGKITNDPEQRLDAVLLDIGMPDGDGRDFCATLRRHGHKMPVIMLTGRNGEADIVRGLDLGANDYVAKPFRLNELLARLRAQLRIFDISDSAVFSVGPYTFQPGKRLLQDLVRNRRIVLTRMEAALLRALHLSDDRAVTRDDLSHKVWGRNSAATTHSLETHIYRLRQKMEANPRKPVLLISEGGGYRLNPMG
jgi:DNA-binding response OmpR family regulator